MYVCSLMKNFIHISVKENNAFISSHLASVIVCYSGKN